MEDSVKVIKEGCRGGADLKKKQEQRRVGESSEAVGAKKERRGTQRG